MIRGNDPILLTPGPLTTSLETKQAMLRDWGSWDAAFNAITGARNISTSISADTDTAVVLGLSLHLVRTVQVDVPDRGSVSVGTVLDVTTTATPASVVSGLASAAEIAAQRTAHQLRAQVIPGLLVVFALVLLAFGIPKLVRRRPKAPPTDSPTAGSPRGQQLAEAGVVKQPGG
jgi:hypothetical protein